MQLECLEHSTPRRSPSANQSIACQVKSLVSAAAGNDQSGRVCGAVKSAGKGRKGKYRN
jgi:hypothetical protein